MKGYYNLLFLSILLLTTNNLYSQIKGKCVDEFGKGVAYVNITVKGKPTGTVSNLKGDFYFDNLSVKENDSLIFSHLNFIKKTVPIPLSNEEIQLESKVETLKEVIVSTKKRKIKERIVGTKTKSENVVLYYTSKDLGAEVGKIIKVKKNKVYDLKNIGFNITDLGYKSVTFRINFYNIVDGKIDLEKINETDNIVKVSEKGLVNINLSNQYLSFENNFLVSIEWIDFEHNNSIKEENKTMMFSSSVFSGPFVRRNNVNQKWNKEKVKFNCGLGIHLKVEQYSK